MSKFHAEPGDSHESEPVSSTTHEENAPDVGLGDEVQGHQPEITPTEWPDSPPTDDPNASDGTVNTNEGAKPRRNPRKGDKK